LFYLGHSNASGLGSGDVNFLNRKNWAKLNIPSGQGIFFTCGCFGCQLNGSDGDGYGLAAMRNPKGPVAVFGAHGESYAAMGQLALDGMLTCLSASEPPPRVADYWLAAKAGLAHGEMAPLTFWMYDQADGSRGRVPLDTQRLEHLEMWILLGDPALRLPVQPSTIRLASADTASDGKSVPLIGSMPSGFSETMVRLTIERPLGSLPVDLKPVPTDSSRADVMMANHEWANSVVLATYEIQPHQGRFEYTLALPIELPWPRLTVRASAFTTSEEAVGILSLPLSK
jgi:hypothetical protein